YATQKGRLFWGAVFIAMGIGLEFLQELGGIRYFEVYDMFANGLGVILAGALSYTRFSEILSWIEAVLLDLVTK
ncbi:MAG: hypothetical protein OEY89_03595, partial [Gammaproteobacteria bacterium]|nr:hypothetical protein [Gammaproteobacteria bacterium]